MEDVLIELLKIKEELIRKLNKGDLVVHTQDMLEHINKAIEKASK